MKKLNLILPLLCLLLLASCTQTAPTSSEDMLYEVEGFYQTNPGKALRILDNYNVSSLSEKEQAHYCLLRAKVYDVHFQHNNEMDSLLKVAENYYVGGDDKYFEAVTCMYLARYAQVTRQGLDDALNWELKASQSIEQCHNVDERLVSYSQTPTDVQNEIDRIKYVWHQRLGMLYGEMGNWRESITHLKISEIYYAEKQRYRLHMMSSYCLGNSYLAIKEYDSAFVCFDNAMHDAEIIGEKGELLYINNGLANYYLSRYENGEYSDEVEREELLHNAMLEINKLQMAQMPKRIFVLFLVAVVVVVVFVCLLIVLRYRRKKGIELLKIKNSQQQTLINCVFAFYKSNQDNRTKQIFDEFERTYPGAVARLKAAHPDLSDMEVNVAVLSFLHFRAKETADLLGLTENTAMKYRSNVRKKAGQTPISEIL